MAERDSRIHTLPGLMASVPWYMGHLAGHAPHWSPSQTCSPIHSRLTLAANGPGRTPAGAAVKQVQGAMTPEIIVQSSSGILRVHPVLWQVRQMGERGQGAEHYGRYEGPLQINAESQRAIIIINKPPSAKLESDKKKREKATAGKPCHLCRSVKRKKNAEDAM
ncbi:hypothetical protein WMY93_028534 [Mugilogobius chulae]|uniref:Uncharacterized protein n=1 Tax=Mugilogobius chulae TaxID=88201 RepID=A0AAW0MQJ1_9GOBI